MLGGRFADKTGGKLDVESVYLDDLQSKYFRNFTYMIKYEHTHTHTLLHKLEGSNYLLCTAIYRTHPVADLFIHGLDAGIVGRTFVELPSIRVHIS